jgi:hypothetical protein
LTWIELATPSAESVARVRYHRTARLAPSLGAVATDDESAPPRTFREHLAARDSARGEVHAARGQLIAATIELEDVIDSTIVRYFQPAEPERFLQWLLTNLNFNAKLQLLQKMVKAHGLWEIYSDLWNRLDKVREQRNAVAHASLQFLESPLDADDGNYLLSRRTARKGEDITDLVELRAQARSAERMIQEFAALDQLIHAVHESSRVDNSESDESDEEKDRNS